MLHGRNINLSKDVRRTEGDVNGTGGHRHLIHERGAQVISCLVWYPKDDPVNSSVYICCWKLSSFVSKKTNTT